MKTTLANIHNRSKKNRTNQEYFEEIRIIYLYLQTGEKNLKETSYKYTYAKNCYKEYCKNPPVIGAACDKHYFETIASTNLGTVRYANKLRQIFFEQKGVCKYSGTKMILGHPDSNIKASVDHILPLSRGGTKEITNVHLFFL